MTDQPKTVPAIKVVSEIDLHLSTPISAIRKKELQDDLAHATHERIALHKEAKERAKAFKDQVEDRERRMAIASHALVTGV